MRFKRLITAAAMLICSCQTETKPIDADGDGVLAEDDCNDNDAELLSTADDADCDGILSADDCNDQDPASNTLAEDADCDGALTAEDCDDNDAASNTLAEDADCDGVPTAEDCDDDNAALQASADDTDCDGYTDAEEAQAGTDPDDAESVIYAGGWPYNPDKDLLDDPGWDVAATDARLPRFVGPDQYGDTVDIYDFANQGVPVFLDLSTEWCAPCRAVADWLAGGEAPTDREWWVDSWIIVPDLINSGEIIWITVLYEDSNHDNATQQAAVDWHAEYPHPLIPVLIDVDKELHGHIRPTGIPSGNLLTEDLRFMAYDDRGLDDAMNLLVEMYGGE